MYPILLTIGRFSIPTYTVLLDLGLILGLVLTYYEGKRRFGEGETVLDLGLWAVIGGILSGRIGYVLANWNAFAEDWLRAFRIWEGGLSFHGAFLGGLLVLTLFALRNWRVQSKSAASSEALPARAPSFLPGFLELSDALVPGLALGIAFGWAACLMGGCSYGRMGEGIGYALLPDLYGIEAPRFATQAVGLAYSALLFAIFWLLRRQWPFAGAASLLYLLFYFGGMFFLEFTRGDEAIYLGPWRLAQWLDLALALLAGIGIIILWWQAYRAPERPEKVKSEEIPLETEEGSSPVEG